MATKAKSAAAAEDVLSAGKENLDTAIKAGTEAVSKSVEQTMEYTKKGVDAAIASLNDAAAFGKENFEAIVVAGSVTAKGIETLNAEMMAYSKQALEDSIAAAKTLAAAKTAKEYMDISNSLAKTSIDSLIAETNKVSEMAVKMFNDAFAPLTKRLNAAAEIAMKPVAAF